MIDKSRSRKVKTYVKSQIPNLIGWSQIIRQNEVRDIGFSVKIVIMSVEVTQGQMNVD